MSEATSLSGDPVRDAIGFTGGALLALCLVPQIIKLIRTRSARDISLWWTLLYLAGLALTLAYLIMQGALAAWVPLVFEIAACLVTLALKLLYDHTRWGAHYTPDGAPEEHQGQELSPGDASGDGPHGDKQCRSPISHQVVEVAADLRARTTADLWARTSASSNPAP